MYVGVICGFFFLQAKASACRTTFYQDYIGADLFAEIKYGDVFDAFCMLFNVILGKWSKNYFKNVFYKKTAQCFHQVLRYISLT